MDAADARFLPQLTPGTAAFWQGCREGHLLIQHCPACGHFQFYPRSFCTACSQREPDWVAAAGSGTVETFTVVRRPVAKAYEDVTPYVIALVRLDEGPVMMSWVTGCDPEQVSIGMRVSVGFQHWSAEVLMPVFSPVGTVPPGRR